MKFFKTVLGIPGGFNVGSLWSIIIWDCSYIQVCGNIFQEDVSKKNVTHPLKCILLQCLYRMTVWNQCHPPLYIMLLSHIFDNYLRMTMEKPGCLPGKTRNYLECPGKYGITWNDLENRWSFVRCKFKRNVTLCMISRNRDPERPGKYLEGPEEDLETTLNAAGKIWNDREKGRKSYKKFQLVEQFSNSNL